MAGTILDRITLKSLSYTAKHGYYAQERKDGNNFEVDIIAYGAFRVAADQDNELQQTFDYQRAEKLVSRVMKGKSRKLIETLCSYIGDLIFDEFKMISSLTVSVRKLSPPIETDSEYAEITLEWNR